MTVDREYNIINKDIVKIIAKLRKNYELPQKRTFDVHVSRMYLLWLFDIDI